MGPLHVRDVVCRMTGVVKGDGKGPSFWLGHRCAECRQAGLCPSPSRCLRRTHPPGLLTLGRRRPRAPAGRSQSSPGPACSPSAAPPATTAPSTARHRAQTAAGKVLLLPPSPRWPSNAPPHQDESGVCGVHAVSRDKPDMSSRHGDAGVVCRTAACALNVWTTPRRPREGRLPWREGRPWGARPRQGWGICKHCCRSSLQGYGPQGAGRGFLEEQVWSCTCRGVRSRQTSRETPRTRASCGRG